MTAKLSWIVGVVQICLILRRFTTEAEASAFIETLESHELGVYYLDGPEEGRD